MGKPNFDKLKAEGDLKGLIKLLADKDPWVREIAVKVLGDIGYGVTVAFALAKMLKDKSSKIRFHAVIALWRITTSAYNDDRDRIAISALIEALIDEDEGVRNSAAEMLQYMRRDIERVFVDSKAGKGAISTLNKALKDKEVEVRRMAREVLKKMKAQKN